jgi:FAD/FMN-containing dehydrogenase
MIKKKTFPNIDELKSHIKTHSPSFYYSSQTSTVIPYDKIENYFKDFEEFYLCDLSSLPPVMKLNENNNLVTSGAVNWKDARSFLISKGRNILTAPTEDLAIISAGVATSCTGERCFSYGNLRSQIVSLKYINYNGEEISLNQSKDFGSDSSFLDLYKSDFDHYKSLKNAPYPRFEKETDLLIGTEGQLGVITEVELKTAKLESINHLFIVIPKWEDNLESHMEIYHKVQKYRSEIILCELIDSNSFSYLDKEDQPAENKDVIYLEILSSEFEKIYEELLSKLTTISEEDIFEISENKFHHIRSTVPRAIFEANSKMGVTKVGTDVQVFENQFEDLLNYYQDLARTDQSIKYNLFGHFGDAHLHFNFMPKADKLDFCYAQFEELYKKVSTWKASPFAEHGIGFLKQKYIKDFIGENQKGLFTDIKKAHDPYNQFFPKGFMSL